jgi:hypothetical protein
MIDQFLMRLATTIATILAATLVVIAALGFLCGAAYLALREVAAPWLAALATGVGALLFAVLIVMAGRLLARGTRVRARPCEGPGDAQRLAGELGGILGVELGAATRAHAPTVLMVSLLAGVAVGASPRLRKLLLDLVLPR